ncbi:hypothetical protein OVA24_09510 [Luteolibacter sp. SL250]|uniref:hypothetical protein n=1 Tax=Luteolibacter sp. SL250 TaxID=2995170 RepID=UPI00226E842D|nr:hypothetical protein [Luteolibacter sp. SL250]WAC21620.1 hypothetical protein OVA24_09510 [Luteolibacter sp. SL250]
MNPAHRSASTRRIILITALVTFLVTSMAWLGIGGLGYFLMVREEPAFHVTVDHPDTVAVGEEFDLSVLVEGRGGKPLNLGNIDFADGLLDGFEVVSAVPRPGSRTRAFGLTSYYLEPAAKSASRYEFKLRLRARETGFWAGDIDCCTPMGNFLTTHISIDVGFPPAAAGTPEKPAE